MASPVGFGFSVGNGDVRGGGSPTPVTPPSSPVQTFNLNYGSQNGPNALAPLSLLTSAGAGGFAGTNSQLLQLLMRIFQPTSLPTVNAAQPGMGTVPGIGPRIDNGSLAGTSVSNSDDSQSDARAQDLAQLAARSNPSPPAPTPTPSPYSGIFGSIGSPVAHIIAGEQGPAAQPLNVGQFANNTSLFGGFGGATSGGVGPRIDNGAVGIPISNGVASAAQPLF